MAGPFGGHPTLERYLNWLREQGFQYRTGYADLEERSVLLIMVQNSDGEDVFIIGDTEMDERLTPSQVSYYDSVFGVSSPSSRTPE